MRRLGKSTAAPRKKEAYSGLSRLTEQGFPLARHEMHRVADHVGGALFAFGLLSTASILVSLADVNVFVPEPVQSGGSDNERRDYNPTGPSRINEVKVGRSTAAEDDQCQCQNEIYGATERTHAVE
jgi:hypothetical protein